MKSYFQRRRETSAAISKGILAALMVCGLAQSNDSRAQDPIAVQEIVSEEVVDLKQPVNPVRNNDFVLPNQFQAAAPPTTPAKKSTTQHPNPLRRGVVSPIVPETQPMTRVESSVDRSHLRLIPNTFELGQENRATSFNGQEINGQEILQLESPEDFVPRDQPPSPLIMAPQLNAPGSLPPPLAQGMPIYVDGDGQLDLLQSPATRMSRPGYNGWNPEAGRDEYVYDGSDRGVKVQVDRSFNVSGLQTEDTVGHFDTLDGRRIVSPSNRVAIYAPRFAAVRRIDGVFNANLNLPIRSVDKKLPIASAQGRDQSSTTKQHLAVTRFAGSKRASGFIDQTRGVVQANTTHLFGIRNNFQPFENLSLIRFGKFSSGETARLSLGIQSARVWEDDLGLQVTVNKATPVITRDVKTVQELLHVKSEDGTAILSVTKVASKIAARAGDTVEFTIRYDNMSNKKIGNVTIIDNLTRRLEYIPDSAESSLKADFINKRNEADSLMLRWEITDPVEPHSGGVIRFKCRVR